MAIKTIKAYDTSIIRLDINTSSIVSVETKTKLSNTYYGRISNFTLSGDVLVLRRTYAEIKVTYETSDQERELEQRVPTSELEKKLAEINNSPETLALKNKANEVAAKLASQEAITVQDVGATLEGFEALAAPVLENVKSIFGAFPVKSTSAAAGATQTAEQTSNSNLITGKTTGNGAPNLIIAHASPKALNEIYQGENPILTTTKSTIDQILKNSSAAQEEITVDNVADDPMTEAGTQVKKTTSSHFKRLSDPAVQTKETSFANLLAQTVGLVKDLVQEDFNTPLQGLKDDLPDLIDEFRQTNISKNVINGLYIDPTTKSPPTNLIQQLGGDVNAFGTAGERFDIVDTLEEFHYDIATCKRDITAALIHWTRTYSDQYLTAYDINDMHTELQKQKIGAQELAAKGQEAGIMWHYCILKDGTLQRGRPIELDVIEDTAWAKRTIHIGFVAGFNVPFDEQDPAIFPTPDSITTSQWKTFDAIVNSLILLKPGIGITGHNSVHRATACPGFDVETYIQDKWNYHSSYTTSKLNTDNPLTPEELASLPATKIANAQKGFERSEIVADVLSNRNTNTDKNTGKTKLPTAEEITQAIEDAKNKIIELDQKDIQLKIKEAAAQLEEQFSIPRIDLDKEVSTLRLDKEAAANQLGEIRQKVVNAGYEFNSEEQTWLKKQL